MNKQTKLAFQAKNEFNALLASLFFCCSGLNAQLILTTEEVTDLPQVLNEASTLETVNGEFFWSLNDGGNRSVIYQFNLDGTLIDSVRFNKVRNNDFEALALDTDKNIMYLGDVGNNANLRDTLIIYKFPLKNVNGTDRVTPQVIKFYYPDKKELPADEKNCAFDCEAIFHLDSSIYLFSKSRCKNKFSKCYRIPEKPGIYAAELLDSIELPTWVTSADVSPDGKAVVLLSETRLYLFTDFERNNFFSGKMESGFLGIPSQKEGVVFADNDTVFISDERWSITGGKIYRVELGEYLK